MSSYPNSVAATHGSENDFPPLPSTSILSKEPNSDTLVFESKLATLNIIHNSPSTSSVFSSSTINTPDSLGTQRLTSWLRDPIDEMPRYTYTSSDERLTSHLTEMAENLKNLENLLVEK